MGLDMYIYRITKPEDMDADRLYDMYDIEGDHLVLDREDMKLPMYKQLLPYMVKARVIQHYYDTDKISKDYNLPDARLCRICGNTTSFYSRGVNRTVDINSDDIDRKYTKDKVGNCYVCKANGIRYWRKEYDVQDWFHDKIKDVENVGFYLLPDNIIKEYNDTHPNDAIEPCMSDGTALFYHEWY